MAGRGPTATGREPPDTMGDGEHAASHRGVAIIKRIERRGPKQISAPSEIGEEKVSEK